jgi:hypothetical protein
MSVRARGSHRASVDTVVVEVRPDDLPIGAPIKTLADANGTISIDGKPVSGTGAGGNTLSYTLLSRTTRMAPEGPAACKSSVPFFGTVASDVSGVKSLEGLVRDCNSPNYILILDGANGLDSGAADEFDKLLSMIGGDSLTDVDRSTITSACPFSVIGIPDAPETSAFTNFNSVGCGGTSAGQLSGYLQVSTATNEYGFVFPDYVPFDTHAENAPYHYNTMKVGGRSYRVGVMADGGFQTLVVDPRTLQPEADSNRDWITNTGDPAYDRNPDHLDELADYIQTQVIDRHRLLFLQSVGRPEPANTAWNDVADKIEALGGSRTVFNEISGNDSYAFVGGPGLTPAEASSTLVHPDTGARQPGHLQGVLSRTRTAEFAPTVSTTTGQVVQDVLPTVYGPAHSFQPFVGGEQAANAYFTKLIFGDKAKPLDMRAHYWLAFGDNWDGYRDRIHDATYAKAESECDCTSTEFTAVQAKLISEIDDLRDVKSWVGRLQAMVDPTQDLFNLNKVSLDIQRAVQPPDVEARNVDGVALISAGLAIGSSVFEEAAAPLSIAATLLGLYGGTQSGADGSELLGEIQTKTSDLGSQLLKRYTLAKSALTGIGQIVVSDPVKLKTVAANVRNDGSGWKLPTDLTPLTTAQNQGAKQWFYTALMPVAWARWELRGIANARYWYCFSTYPDEVQPWSNAPDSAQYKAVIGFVDDPRTGKVTPNRVVRALGIRVIPAFIDVPAPDGQALPPPGDLTNPLFKTPILDVGSNRLGLYPEQFYEEQFEPRGPAFVDRNCVHSR